MICRSCGLVTADGISRFACPAAGYAPLRAEPGTAAAGGNLTPPISFVKRENTTYSGLAGGIDKILWKTFRFAGDRIRDSGLGGYRPADTPQGFGLGSDWTNGTRNRGWHVSPPLPNAISESRVPFRESLTPDPRSLTRQRGLQIDFGQGLHERRFHCFLSQSTRHGNLINQKLP